jgi:signal transduction histidine kinase
MYGRDASAPVVIGPCWDGAEMNVTRPSWPVLLPALFILVIVSFGAATVFSQARAAAIDRHALVVAERAAPAILRLSEARRNALYLAIAVREQFEDLASPDPSTPAQIHELREALNRSVEQYRRGAGPDPQDVALADRIVWTTTEFFASIDRVATQFGRADTAAARSTLDNELRRNMLALNDALLRAGDHNADLAQHEANEIRRLRTSSSRLARGLDIASAALALVAGLVLWGAMRTHAALLTRLRRLSDERATELDAFAGRVAHDIRGPLSVIALVLDVAGRSPPGTQNASALERGRRAAARVTRLVDGLLAFARGGAEHDRHERADVHDAATDVLDQLQSAAEKAGVELQVDVANGLTVRCATGVLTSIIANLAGNAIKYMQDAPKRSVVIRAFREDGFVRVEVEDTGPGIPAGFESKIFDPFVRATKGSEDGVGLGLATVRRLAQAYGGSSGVRSNAGGPGSTFWVRLAAAVTLARPNSRSRAFAVATR